MEKVQYILGKPEYIDGVGDIHPIILNDYDIFIDCATPLYYSKQHFQQDINEFNLLDVIVVLGLKERTILQSLEKLFSLVTRKKTYFVMDEGNLDNYAFVIDKDLSINKDNYDIVRQTIMKQNLIFEPKVFKNKLVQQWAEKVIKARAKNSVKITIEDMITTVSNFKGKSYKEIAEQTLYQLNADFQQITKFKSYDSSIALANIAGLDKLEHFAGGLNLFKNPYDDLFVSKDKLNKLDSAMT